MNDQVQIDPVTGERIQKKIPQIDPQTGERIPDRPGPAITDKMASDAWKAATYSKMLDVPPSYAYQNADEIGKQMKERSPDFDRGIGYAAETGWEETPLGMLIRGQAPAPFESHDLLGNFVHDIVGMATDPAFIIPTLAGTLLGQPELGAAVGFALSPALRQGIMDHYQKGNVKSFGDLAYRAGDILWAATKGLATGEAGVFAGKIPVGKMIGKSVMGSAALRGLYQAGAMTAMGDLLDWRIPNAEDFTRSAAVIVPLNILTGGVFLKGKPAEQSLMDVFAKTGESPQESVVKLQAQPPVKPDIPAGLRPAIDIGEGSFIEANPGETHPELAERVLGEKAISIDELNADPKLADKVLDNPEIHLQQVVDRAVDLKKEFFDQSGEGQNIEDLYALFDKEFKSGRGFVTPEGKFLNRTQARAWMKTNEPDVYKMWSRITGNEKSEFHSDDYNQARERLNNLNAASGDPEFDTVSPDTRRRLAALRKDLNKIKAGDASGKYTKEVLRTLFVGQRDSRIALATQIRDQIRRVIPDYRDQEALSFLRDYKSEPEALRREMEAIQAGSDEKLKALIPSIERALNPSPELLQADRIMTSFYDAALNEGREFGFLESGIPSDRYVTHVLMKPETEAEPKRLGRPRIATRTPYSIERKYPTILDALKTGQVDARTVNATDALAVYGDRHATAVASKLLVTELKNTELGKWGTQEDHPEGWVELAPRVPGFQYKIPIVDAATGEARIIGQSLYVPEVIADAMKPITKAGKVFEDSPAIQKAFEMTRHAQAYIKAVELGLSVFHMKAMTITAMNNMEYGQFFKAMRADLESPEFAAKERSAAADGLTTTKTTIPYEVYQGLKPSSFPSRLDLLRGKFPIKQLDALSAKLTAETFDVIQRKFKVMDFSQKEASWLAKHPEATDQEYMQARRGIAKEINAAYGGLNWELLGWGKNARELARAFILAPDWTFSNVVNLKYVGEGGAGGAAARMFWFKSISTGLLMTQAMSIIFSGQTSSHPTEVYYGKDDKGKEMYASWFFAGAPKDLGTWLAEMRKDGPLTGTAKFLSYKLGPLVGTGFRLGMNKDWRGKAITKPEEGLTGLAKNTGRELEFVANQNIPLPFWAKNIETMLTDPDQEFSYRDFLHQLAGVTVMHVDPPKNQQPRRKEAFHLPGVQRSTRSSRPGVTKRR